VKSPQQYEPVPGAFEGRTFDEAVGQARQFFGNDAPVRCWKIRRGGVLGFFTQEAFVAGVTPPFEATTRVKTEPASNEIMESQGPKGPKELKSARRGLALRASRLIDSPQNASLSDLVERTRDQVDLGVDSTPDADFSAVLAQAEAALSVAETVLAPRPVRDDPVEPVAPGPIEGLTASLVAVGIPVEFRPGESEITLDGLVHSLARLPRAPSVPTSGGSVIIVVGARRDALTAAQQVVTKLGLESSDLVEFDRTSAGRQRVARRRAAQKVTVLVVEASLRSRGLVEVASWIEKLQPDQVLGAVPATAKRADVAHWRAQLGRIDALALSRMAQTTTAAELMGEIPIAFVDGAEASPLRWVWLLLNSVLEHGQ
jgi:hypothetical protein